MCLHSHISQLCLACRSIPASVSTLCVYIQIIHSPWNAKTVDGRCRQVLEPRDGVKWVAQCQWFLLSTCVCHCQTDGCARSRSPCFPRSCRGKGIVLLTASVNTGNDNHDSTWQQGLWPFQENKGVRRDGIYSHLRINQSVASGYIVKPVKVSKVIDKSQKNKPSFSSALFLLFQL